MKTVTAIILLAIVAVIAFIILVKVAQKAAEAWRARRDQSSDWEVDQDDLPDGSTQVMLSKPGEPSKFIGAAIPCTLPQWEFQEVLIERRLEAQAKANDLNRRLPA